MNLTSFTPVHLIVRRAEYSPEVGNRLSSYLHKARDWYEREVGITWQIALHFQRFAELAPDSFVPDPAIDGKLFWAVQNEPVITKLRDVGPLVVVVDGNVGDKAYGDSSGLVAIPLSVLSAGIVAHALGHLFGLLDQYDLPTVPDDTPTNPFDNDFNLMDDEGWQAFPACRLTPEAREIVRRSPWVLNVQDEPIEERAMMEKERADLLDGLLKANLALMQRIRDMLSAELAKYGG